MAHPRVIAQRQGTAATRITAAAQALAESANLDASLVSALSVYDRDPDTRQVMRQEAVADLLEALAGQKAPQGAQETQDGGGQPTPVTSDTPPLAGDSRASQSVPRRGPGRPRRS